jgi:hypothetical protein
VKTIYKVYRKAENGGILEKDYAGVSEYYIEQGGIVVLKDQAGRPITIVKDYIRIDVVRE